MFRRGVTLIELLIVILVMLLITAVTIPAISPALEGRKIREAARMVEVFLNGARNRAVATGHSVGVLIEPDPKEPSQCIALSYVEQQPPYAGDYSTSTVLILGNGGFGAWQTIPPPGNPSAGVVSTDAIFPKGDIGWIQNVAPGDLMTLGTNDTITYRIYAGEPFVDINNDGQYTKSGQYMEPFSDVDGDGAYTPPNPSIIDPITGMFTSIPPITWGTQSAFVTYTYADTATAMNYMTNTGRQTGSFAGQPIYLSFRTATAVGHPAQYSTDPTNSGSPFNPVTFQFLRRPVPSSTVKLNLPAGTCIDLGSNYVDPATQNIVGIPGSGLDGLVPFWQGGSHVVTINGQTVTFINPNVTVGTLGSFSSFRPNPLTDHEIVGSSASTLVNRPIMITFDQSGVVDMVYSYDERNFITNTSQSVAAINFTNYQGRQPTSPIYLLIGQRELIDGQPERLPTLPAGMAPLKPIFNVQDPTSLWVCINPRTGSISTTENNAPDLTKAPPTAQTQASPQIQLYFNAQAYSARSLARGALDMGGM